MKTEESIPLDVEIDCPKASVLEEIKANVESIIQVADTQPLLKIVSPIASAIESRCADEDLLGGMDIEQISDEELEDEAKSGRFVQEMLLKHLFYSYYFELVSLKYLWTHLKLIGLALLVKEREKWKQGLLVLVSVGKEQQF